MSAKLEVLITEHRGRMEFDFKVTGKRSPREDAHLVALVAAIEAAVKDFEKVADGCNCPACQRRREREADYARQNLH
ncbi:hypothetical protein [Pantoea sp.]|uniref:hypothetical protein n=1 Tax=Pantoea sp. TaxID=69393 RepID=UPI00289AA7FA|nr:hypothetical protein [Pantoea sp.]